MLRRTACTGFGQAVSPSAGGAYGTPTQPAAERRGPFGAARETPASNGPAAQQVSADSSQSANGCAAAGFCPCRPSSCTRQHDTHARFLDTDSGMFCRARCRRCLLAARVAAHQLAMQRTCQLGYHRPRWRLPGVLPLHSRLHRRPSCPTGERSNIPYAPRHRRPPCVEGVSCRTQ